MLNDFQPPGAPEAAPYGRHGGWPWRLPTVLPLLLLVAGAAACSARNPVADAYPEWEVDNSPWDVPPSDGIDGIDGWPDGVPDTVPDYPTEFDLVDQDYVPDLPETDGTVPVRPCDVILATTPPSPSDTINVAGEFNGWSASADRFTDDDGDGIFTVTLDVDEGEWAYKLVRNGTAWYLDPDNPWTKYVCTSGTCELNSNLRVSDCELPAWVMLSYEALPSGTINAAVQYVDGNNAAGPDPASVKVYDNGTLAAGTFDAATGLLGIALTSLPAGKHMLRIEGADAAGRAARPLYLPGWIEPQPWDWRDATLYFAFTDRFNDGLSSNNHPIGVEQAADYRGGDFEGIRRKIEDGYVASMGVNVLWISPPYENPTSSGIGSDGHDYSGYHGYWPVDPLAAETTFGGDADLEALLETAHRSGIRVLMDSVLNHVHIEHPYWDAHRADGWFHGSGDCICGQGSCDWDSHRIDCWFTPYLPDIDYTKHDALVTMVDDSLAWIFEVGFDGLRVDAVKHFEHIVGQRLALEMNERYELAGQRFYMVGETFTGGYGGGCGGGPDFIMQYINPTELDGQFDFPLFWVLLDVFARESADFNWLDQAVRGLETCYGSYPVMSVFLGNHDVARFISVANGDNTTNPWGSPPPTPSSSLPYQRLRLAFTFLLTTPGIPLIYYGDEIGLPGAADPDNRRLMKFSGLSGNEQMVLSRVQLAGTARQSHAALRRGERRTLYVDANVYVFARGTGSDAVIVALNRNSFEVTTSPITIPSGLSLPSGTVLTDLVSSRTATVSGGTIVVTVGAKDGAILVQ
jgi:glycosidase